jgi:hypothetical protein
MVMDIPTKQKGKLMLHLAQVERNKLSGELMVRLLACQRSEYAWTVLNHQDLIPLKNLQNYSPQDYSDGLLVLVDFSEANQIVEIRDAKDWMLSIVKSFLLSGITPAFLQEESERAEQWRQTLTLQSQDLDRRALELEARREQLEQLEETLKREKKQIEFLSAQYKEQTQELDRRTLELQTRQDQLERLDPKTN